MLFVQCTPPSSTSGGFLAFLDLSTRREGKLKADLILHFGIRCDFKLLSEKTMGIKSIDARGHMGTKEKKKIEIQSFCLVIN